MGSSEGILNFWNLPENLHVVLRPRFRYMLLKEFMDNVKTKYNANKITKICRITMSNYINKDNPKIRIDFLLRICGIVNQNSELDLEGAQRNIMWIGHFNSKGIINPKLPFNFNSRKGARFLAAICNEGWISDGTYYSNSSQELRDSVKKDALSVFGGDKNTIKEWIRENDRYLAFPSVMRDALMLITKFKGVKSENNPPVPEFILKDKNLICGWIEQTIADEGHVKYHKKLYRREINWKRSFSESLDSYIISEAERQMLTKIGIRHNMYNTERYKTKKGKKKIRIRINITERRNLIRLRRIIFIPIKRKEELLTNMTKGFVRYKEPLRIKEAIIRICKKRGYVTSTELKEDRRYKETGTAIKWLKFYQKKGVIMRSKDYSYGIHRGRIPARYSIKTPQNI